MSVRCSHFWLNDAMDLKCVLWVHHITFSITCGVLLWIAWCRMKGRFAFACYELRLLLKLQTGLWQGPGWSVADPSWIPALSLAGVWSPLDYIMNTAYGNQLQCFIYPPGGAVIMEAKSMYCDPTAVVFHLGIFIVLMHLKWAVLIVFDVFDQGVCFPHRAHFERRACYYEIISSWKHYAGCFL